MLQHTKSLTDGMIIYSVVLENFEKLDFRNDALAGVRANYFNSDFSCQHETTEITLDKVLYNLAYDLRKDKPISWKITKNGRPYQSVKYETGGVYTIFYYADNGIITKRQYFNSEHSWMRTEYYDTDSLGRMVCRVEPYEVEGVIALKVYTYEIDGSRTEKLLFPSKNREENECGALMYSNIGMLWYDESFSPELAVEEDESVSHNGFVINTDRFAKDYVAEEKLDLANAQYLEAEEIEVVAENTEETPAETEANAEYSAYDKIEDILREAHKTNKSLFGEVLNHSEDEAITEDNSIEENTESEIAKDNSIEENTESEIAKDNSTEENSEAEKAEENSTNENTEAETAEENSTKENTEAETVEDNSVEENTEAEISKDNSVEENTEAETTEDNSAEENTEAETTEDNSTEENTEAYISSEEPECKSVISNNGGDYRYFGELDEQNRRTGRGRTVSPNGTTSYEGFYKDDKRDGFGVCYYKSGEINYVGSWSNNNRSGSGVGYRQSDGTMHAGMWNNNTPDGCGARFDAEGGFLEAGFFENGVRNGVCVTFDENQNVVVTKWKNGEKLSEFIVNTDGDDNA